MTLRSTLTAALLAAPLALAAVPGAQAAPWTFTHNSFGNSGQGTLRGPNGQRITVTDTTIGDSTQTIIKDDKGNRVRCSRIGNMTTCY